MAIAKLMIDAGKGLLLEKTVDKLFEAYNRFRSDAHSHEETINGYQIADNNYFSGGTIREIANRYGIESILSDYNQSLFENIRKYLASLGKLAEYLRDIAQQKISAASVEIYTKVKNTYDLMAGLLGFKAPQETNRYGYLSDLVNDYLHKIGDLNSRLDRFLYLAEGFNKDGSGIVGAAAKRTARFIAKQVLNSKGILYDSIDSVVSSITNPFAQMKKQVKRSFADYQDVVRHWQTAYASDISSYLSRNYGVAA